MSSPCVPFVQTAQGQVEAAGVEISSLVRRLYVYSPADISSQIQQEGSLNLTSKRGLFYLIHSTMKPISIHFSLVSLCLPSSGSLLFFVFAACFMNK